MKRRLVEITLVFMSFFLPGFLRQDLPLAGDSFPAAGYMLGFLLLAAPQTLLLGYLLWLQKDPPLSLFGMVRIRLRDPLWALGILSGLFLLILVLGLAASLISGGKSGLLEKGFRWRLSGASQLPLAALFSVVTGYREELFFRCYLLTRLGELGVPPLFALLAGGLLFSSGHLYQGPAGLLLGLVQGFYFGTLFLKFRNIHPLALAHGLYNFSVLLATLWL